MEDYKEKYEHLLKFINDLYPYMSDYCKEKTEGFIPGLKEPEDEKIRKEIIQFLQLPHPQFVGKRNYEKWITWLEKQDPKKHEEELENAYKCADEVQYRRGYEDAKREFKKQCEQQNKVFIWKHWKDGIAGNGEDKPIFLIKNGDTYSLSSCLGYECDYIELSELNKLLPSKKQGEQKPVWSENVKRMFIKALERVEEQNNKGYKLTDCDKNSWWEDFKAYSGYSEQILANSEKNYNDEQMTVDKVEPKFKVGDWIINSEGTLRYILDVGRTGYETNEGWLTHDIYENGFHLWTIQDAKDGDVLCDYSEEYNNPLIFILKKFEHVNFGLVKPSDYSSYCFLTAGDRQKFKEGSYHHKCNIKPATKEQRDQLEKAMKEAGYEWDVEKKELKKIEQISTDLPNGEDYGIDGLYAAVDILQKTLGNVNGYQTDDGILEHECAISAVKKLYEQKPAWSEENSCYYDDICEILINLINSPKSNVNKDAVQKDLDWLISLRSQQKQEWSKEDKGNLLDVKCIIDEVWHNQHVREEINHSGEELESLWHWLDNIWQRVDYPKSLLKKPAWSEEDEKTLNSILNDLSQDVIPDNEDIQWLKSLKERHTWKPCDEQMKQLGWVAEQNKDNTLGKELMTLYQDLKKLREG